MKASVELASGTLIDNRYRIQKLLGSGGLGRTYLVTDERRFDEQCVLKEFVPTRRDPEGLEKARLLFQREAKVLHQLAHPQIPKFLAWFEEKQRLFLVQEYLEGKNYLTLLNERKQEGKKFSEAEILRWLQALLPVLDYIHRTGVIHRDISPDNIMLPTGEGETGEALPVLIDFGVVKQAIAGNRDSASSSGKPTAFVGKVGYSPPEQLHFGQCYPSSDLYALAASAVVLLTGKLPSQLFDCTAMEWQWRDRAQIGETLGGILDKMLIQKPQFRYPSAADVLSALSPVVPSRSWFPLIANPKSTAVIPASPASKTPRLQQSPEGIALSPQHRRNAIILGSVTLFCLGLLGIGWHSPYISWICKPFNYCARDREFQELYQQTLDDGTKARLQTQKAETLKTLETARDRLQQAVLKLETVPKDVTVYPEAQQMLAYYRHELERVDLRLTREQTAAKQLEAIEKQAKKIERQIEAAASKRELERARSRWKKLLLQLKQIPNNTSSSDRARTLRDRYENRLSDLEAQIERTPDFATRRVLLQSEDSIPLRSMNFPENSWEQ
ncbi:protein kinase domain-containing protein [Lusitaniella coriacea]|uniref:protein kinase domain-containing protein n=1 Tax=Lusitaniella coriacea TaxID=1983105 RepID=UPI002D2187CA|nr:protein kinase [Lusitaniella coriacea]